MVDEVLERWRLAGFSLVHLCMGAVAFESRLTQRMGLFLSGLPYADLNMAILWGAEGGGEDLAWVVARSESLRVPCLILTPEAGSGAGSGAGGVCRSVGLVAAGVIPLMRLVGGDLVESESGGVCGLAENDGEVLVANGVTAAAFGLPLDAVGRVFGSSVPRQPGLRVYVARYEGSVVSGLRVSRIGEVAVIWCMATGVGSQRRGFGRRLLSTAIAAERAAGATEFLLLATEVGQPLYRSVGFEVISEASAWVQGASYGVGEGAGDVRG